MNLAIFPSYCALTNKPREALCQLAAAGPAGGGAWQGGGGGAPFALRLLSVSDVERDWSVALLLPSWSVSVFFSTSKLRNKKKYGRRRGGGGGCEKKHFFFGRTQWRTKEKEEKRTSSVEAPLRNVRRDRPMFGNGRRPFGLARTTRERTSATYPRRNGPTWQRLSFKPHGKATFD